MRAETLRRLLVFGVCAVGVGCLYLAPSMAGSPDQLGSSPPSDEPTRSFRNASTGAPGSEATSVRSLASGSGRGGDPTSAPVNTDAGQGGGGHRRPVQGATAYDPDSTEDNEAPTAVEKIRPAQLTKRKLGLTWSPASDNVSVVGYRVLVNGFPVATTTETHAEVNWFNDDAGQHVVQVRAVDGKGNESQSSPTLVVTRPSADPSPSPTVKPAQPVTPTEPPASVKPQPTDSPEPQETASAAASANPVDPTVAPNPETSGSSTP